MDQTVTITLPPMQDLVAWLNHYLALEREAHILAWTTPDVEPYVSARARLLPYLGEEVQPPDLYLRKSPVAVQSDMDFSETPRKVYQIKRQFYRAPSFAPTPVGEFFRAYVGPIEGRTYYLMNWFIWPGPDGAPKLQAALYVCGGCKSFGIRPDGEACTQCAGIGWVPALDVGPDGSRYLGGKVLEVHKVLRPTRVGNAKEYDRPDGI